jgi:hypothetical protein
MKQASVPSAPQTVNTSLIRECLELILLLGDAMDRKKAERPITVSQNSLPVTPHVAPVQPFGSAEAMAV